MAIASGIRTAANQRMVIGLGDRCQIAYQIKHRGLTPHLFPFDYLRAPFDSLYKVIDDDFAEFLEPRYLTTGILEGRRKVKLWEYVKDTRTGLEFHHDFPPNQHYTLALDRVRAKFIDRIQNFRNVIHSGNRVAFVRIRITRDQAVRFHELIRRKYPHLDYVLVALDHSDEIRTDWELDRTRNFYLVESEEWRGDFDTWSAVFVEAGLTYCEKQTIASVILSTSMLHCLQMPTVMSMDASYYFDVIAHNTGSVPWPLGEPFDVRISYRWLSGDGEPLHGLDCPSFVPWTIQPGHDVAVKAVVIPPPIPGKYRLQWELSVKESTLSAITRAPTQPVYGTEIPVRVR